MSPGPKTTPSAPMEATSGSSVPKGTVVLLLPLSPSRNFTISASGGVTAAASTRRGAMSTVMRPPLWSVSLAQASSRRRRARRGSWPGSGRHS